LVPIFWIKAFTSSKKSIYLGTNIESLSEFQENNAYNDILNLEVKQDAIISTDAASYRNQF
jgi:hypothetical protein